MLLNKLTPFLYDDGLGNYSLQIDPYSRANAFVSTADIIVAVDSPPWNDVCLAAEIRSL